MEELEQEELDAKMLETPSPAVSAPNVPVHAPGKDRCIHNYRLLRFFFCFSAAARANAFEDDEEAELRALQASMAM